MSRSVTVSVAGVARHRRRNLFSEAVFGFGHDVGHLQACRLRALLCLPDSTQTPLRGGDGCLPQWRLAENGLRPVVGGYADRSGHHRRDCFHEQNLKCHSPTIWPPSSGRVVAARGVDKCTDAYVAMSRPDAKTYGDTIDGRRSCDRSVKRRFSSRTAVGGHYPATMASIPSVLCVHAHPDDEALFTGGILARSAAAGARTAVVTCTWSEGTVRVDELRRSLSILGAGEPRLLGYTDDAFADGVAFCAAPFDEAVGALVGHIRDFRPDIVVTYDGFGSYGHPDHVHAHRVTLAAVEASGYAQLYPDAGVPWQPEHLLFATFPRSAIEDSWNTLFGGPAPAPGPGVPGMDDADVDLAIDIRPWFDTKWEAFSQHESEIARGGSASQFAGLSEKDRRDLMGTEWFVHRRRSSGDAAPDPFLPSTE